MVLNFLLEGFQKFLVCGNFFHECSPENPPDTRVKALLAQDPGSLPLSLSLALGFDSGITQDI
jgi:hypothetical protein